MKVSKILSAAILGASLFLTLYAQASDKEKIIYTFTRASHGSGEDWQFFCGRLFQPGLRIFPRRFWRVDRVGDLQVQ